MSLSKQYLQNPERIAQIQNHREKRKELDPTPPKIRVIDPEPFVMHDYDSTLRNLTHLKEIFLKNMRGKRSHSYDGHFIELTIIEESYFEYSTDDFATAYKFLVEDKNGDVISLQVLGLPQNENTSEMFAVGMKIILMEPFCRYLLYSGSDWWLRVDETKTKNIIPVGRKKDMCRYCGEENAGKRCANCKYNYCGRECQQADWKILRHKLVCKIKDDVPISSFKENEDAMKKSKKKTGSMSSSSTTLGKRDGPKVTSGRRKIKDQLSPEYIENPRFRHSLWIRMGIHAFATRMEDFDYNFYFPKNPVEDSLVPPRMTKPLENLQRIHLKDMEYEDFYEGKFIEVTIIEEPFIADQRDPKVVAFVVEDGLKGVCNLVVYGIPWTEDTSERFLFGTKLMIVNPAYKIREADLLLTIRVDDPKMVVYLGKKTDMCRYCGKENATMKCAKCKHNYCGRECKLADKGTLFHDLVCQTASDSEKIKDASNVPSSKLGSQGQAKAGKKTPKQKGSKEAKEGKVSPTKAYLDDPVRLARILNIRQKIRMMATMVPLYNLSLDVSPSFPGTLFSEAKTPLKPNSGWEEIFLKNMKCDNFYKNKYINLTTIDDPLSGYGPIHFVVEDENKDVTNLAVNGLPQTKETCDRLPFGTKFLVKNPVYKVGAADGIPMIRVDDLKMILLLGKNPDLCRCFVEDKAKIKCGNCTRMYCGKECRDKDLKLFRHELVCTLGALP